MWTNASGPGSTPAPKNGARLGTRKDRDPGRAGKLASLWIEATRRPAGALSAERKRGKGGEEDDEELGGGTSLALLLPRGLVSRHSAACQPRIVIREAQPHAGAATEELA
eukprot:CAMPEP_0177552052 /NCGR_PEP_ID=MMETSP0369-20130122/66570_1 /TAXON_ID=447022 ORGANISM="Scrippsiella hangoei-like, Strain SHHI-4" /NCGR_SAMPLE_ID=MMETSP0369 /ASSEMBLY_ACC=CAM_ASM_000364 /LENGTH=109 /DNA_ID=CAMNT_0019037635 /DNA_START=24 /DNA_END=349 /DNA_ORIENTATION=-